jgi:hypothetical protein
LSHGHLFHGELPPSMNHPALRPGHRGKKPSGLSIDTTLSNLARGTVRDSVRSSFGEWQSPLLRRKMASLPTRIGRDSGVIE